MECENLMCYKVIKKIFDSAFAIVVLLILFVPIIIITLLVKATSKGPVFYWSERIGRDNKIFTMPKFRTMRMNTPDVATHLMVNPAEYLTSIGPILRKFSLDELPQLWSVLRGDMSLVGPRPALYNQDDLIALRTKKGIHKIIPGITGWAQVNGRDNLPIPAKVELDEYYLNHRSMLFDLKVLWLTLIKVIKRKDVAH